MGEKTVQILVVIGTRPEAIKLAPVVGAFRERSNRSGGTISVKVCATGQHREMLAQALQIFGIVPDFNLDIMSADQSPDQVVGRVLEKLTQLFRTSRPDLVIVQGDTTTTLGASLAAFYEKIPVAHVEAGLRTGNPLSPWPEEMNRKLTASIASLHFAPTAEARNNLLREGIADSAIELTGNTVVDALQQAIDFIAKHPELEIEFSKKFSYLNRARKLILVTGHRRENLGHRLDAICRALRILGRRSDVDVVYPVHLNPSVKRSVATILSNCPQVYITEPLDYLPFVYLMNRSFLILTDSGGIQEEAPYLGKPVLITRDATERPEAVQAGAARLVGSDSERIVEEVTRLLDNHEAYSAMTGVRHLFGDGKASHRIVERCVGFLRYESRQSVPSH